MLCPKDRSFNRSASSPSLRRTRVAPVRAHVQETAAEGPTEPSRRARRQVEARVAGAWVRGSSPLRPVPRYCESPLCLKARGSSLSPVGRKADPYWAAQIRTIAPTPSQGSSPAPRGPWWRRRKWIWSLLVLLLVLVSAGAWAFTAGTDSRPIIVRGHIQTNGEEVWVWVTVSAQAPQRLSAEEIANVTTKGDFVLRGEMSATDARNLVLYVDPTGYVPISCSYDSNLPPLRLADDRWVEDATGEPLIVAIDLPLIPNGEIAC